MELLIWNNNKVELSPEAAVEKHFKRIWDRDKSKTKEKAQEDLAYIYYFGKYSSIYRNIPEEERRTTLINDIYDNKKEPDKLVEEALQYYIDMQYKSSVALQFLDDAQKALDSVRVYLRTLNMSDVDKNGKPKNDITKITSAIEKTGKLLDSLDNLKDRVKRELGNTGKVRGGVEKSEFEDPEE